MEQFNTIVAILGGLVLLVALGSKGLQKSPLPTTVLALLLGIALGPKALGVIDLSSLGAETKIIEALVTASRMTRAVGRHGTE